MENSDQYIKELHEELYLLDSIMKCMLRYCFDHSIDHTYENKMKELIRNYEIKAEKKIFELTGKPPHFQ